MAYRFSSISGRLIASTPLAAYRPQGIQAYEVNYTSMKQSSSITKHLDKKDDSDQLPQMKSLWDHMTSSEIVHHMTPRKNLTGYAALRQRIHEDRLRKIDENVKYDELGYSVWACTEFDKARLRTLIVLIAAFTLGNLYNAYGIRFGRKK